MTTGGNLQFDIVLPTRNRATILPLSVRLMLLQERPPDRLIVVDSSDDHAQTKRIVEGVLRETSSRVEFVLLRSAAGSAYQRNVGLKHVRAPVVFFPDDDVLWFPDTTSNVMRIYERDAEGVVGCVASAVAHQCPSGAFGPSKVSFKVGGRDRLARQLRRIIGPVEGRLFPDPIDPGPRWRAIWGDKATPAWLADEEAELCGPVFGYRMSFRTEVIQSLGGFDECLGRYAMFEDSDASLGSLQRRLNVCAKRAAVFHYRVPGERVSGWEFGMMAMLNRTYVVCKHSCPGSAARKTLKRYLYYKIARYFLQVHSQYGRRRLAGALYGVSKAGTLINCHSEQLQSRYAHTLRYSSGV
jgi:glycosyltransferase involved in cell wall biosynthesis